jgi:hypothetical protein
VGYPLRQFQPAAALLNDWPLTERRDLDESSGYQLTQHMGVAANREVRITRLLRILDRESLGQRRLHILQQFDAAPQSV